MLYKYYMGDTNEVLSRFALPVFRYAGSGFCL